MDTRRFGQQAIGRIIGAIKLVLSVVLITALVAVGCLMVWRLEGRAVMSVQSASMMPTFRVGDAVIADPVELQSIFPGDVISYHNPEVPSMLITHRVIQINTKTRQLVTQGDALYTPDKAFSARFITGKVTTILPGFGRLLNALRRPLGLVILIYIPALLVISAEMYRWKTTWQPLYRLKRRS